MASTPFISHTVNGYSRYELPENVAFTASAGVLYPVRTDFLNARDVRYIQTGATIRTNPALLPTFTPFRVSLHRFFVPMQLYHPEMRVNSARFDFQNLSTNVVAAGLYCSDAGIANENTLPLTEPLLYSDGRSLQAFLGLWMGQRPFSNSLDTEVPDDPLRLSATSASLGPSPLGYFYVNADPILAYYDIVRSYYSFSQVDSVSFAFPCSPSAVSEKFFLPAPGSYMGGSGYVDYSGRGVNMFIGKPGQYWRQAIGRLEPFDMLYESSFYPKRSEARGLYYDRSPFIAEMLCESVSYSANRSESEIVDVWNNLYATLREKDVPTVPRALHIPLKFFWMGSLPFGVAPSVADRYSRLLPVGETDDVSLSSISTVRGLAFAAKLQAYKDLLSSGGNRFTDWLMTFFAAKVSHVDRPILVYSSSFYLNSSPIFSQQGGESLGTYAGVVEGNDAFGKKAQRYSFDEPGYLMDLFCIRPLYYWSGIQKDFARYDKLDYFNPIFNEVGYETLPRFCFGGSLTDSDSLAGAKQPCYNEFRASYDRVLGDMALVPGRRYSTYPLLSSWVQQRSNIFYGDDSYKDFDSYLSSVYYTDVSQVNNIFASSAEDNFFVNLYYNVTCKSLVSKNFATNLAIR